ncbi:Rrf2 family protein [Clostridium argentinense CDC 2741]|uniref:Rrf2 family protein n=1 Tax=Clostridium argentinense CDC 2741 TaxID=1418104 RepID=A0A0C1R253_9CLOT|nr:Rrf2 family transcriptional regulator [Clostridium argentinense]HAG44577.1 Rrf2 family transcriptional regulator [Clostridium sp.]ARC84324.1 transcriptional regulator [Clostridium argentinense]KIE44531.1 Rrf2 family protein [Clostridium argentinense CDC 2741]NFF38287.1 Rrf2 family transcriptional regulator [Clostridium argentinense]NFP49128.1 Rrf2 family transcriptional regulator [Clostridium argentinense]
MGLTQETDYALRVILYLSRLEKGTIVSANTISEKENIPLRFLLKLLRKLREAKLVESYMGINGGYALNKNPEEISLKDVIEAIEGPIYLNRCLYEPEKCNLRGPNKCAIHSALFSVQKKLVEELSKINFKEIIK